MSLSVVGGLGAILGIFIELYGLQGVTPTQVVWLGTFPSLFVGVGELFILLLNTGHHLESSLTDQRKLPTTPTGLSVWPTSSNNHINHCFAWIHNRMCIVKHI